MKRLNTKRSTSNFEHRMMKKMDKTRYLEVERWKLDVGRSSFLALNPEL